MTYAIDDFPHDHANGLGVTFNFVIWQMLRLREHDTYVNITKPNNPYRDASRGPNVWDYYFDQEIPVLPVIPAPVENPLDLPFSGHRDWTLERQAAVSKFARERIFLRPEIQSEVDSFKRQFFRGSVLAVAVRGTDKLEEYRPMKDNDIVTEIDVLRSQTKADTVFLMTDDIKYHKLITESCGAVSITMPRGKKSLHHNPPNGPFLSGYWMVLDAFIAAGADHFAYTPSNAATMPLIMGEFKSIHRLNRHCVIEPFCQRVDRALEGRRDMTAT